MLTAKLVLVVLVGQAPAGPSDPSGLVAQLGSARYAEREAASAALERLGGPALPALRAVRDARDLEVRTRAYSLIQKIEGALLTQPSRLRLEFDNAPLREVVQALSAQAGFRVALYPENLPRWRTQRVQLRDSGPIPFWKAIDRLCNAAQLQYNPSLHGLGNHREPTFTLTDGSSHTVTPVSDQGPFRVSLLSLHYQRDLNYAGGAGLVPGARLQGGLGRPHAESPARLHPVSSVQFTAQLVVAAEPRLTLSQNGPLHVLEAVDNRGTSLIPSSRGGPISHRFAGYFGVTNGSVLQVQAQLLPPEAVGQSIKKLRGVIPLAVSSRRPDPLVVPLTQGTGKRFENPDVELTLHDIRTAPNTNQTLIELSVTPNARGAAADHTAAGAFQNVMHRPDTQRLQLEVFDSRDQLVPWFPSGIDSETSHLTLTLTHLPQTSSLKELRYHTLTRATVNLPFEFTDIPMP